MLITLTACSEEIVRPTVEVQDVAVKAGQDHEEVRLVYKRAAEAIEPWETIAYLLVCLNEFVKC